MKYFADFFSFLFIISLPCRHFHSNHRENNWENFNSDVCYSFSSSALSYGRFEYFYKDTAVLVLSCSCVGTRTLVQAFSRPTAKQQKGIYTGKTVWHVDFFRLHEVM